MKPTAFTIILILALSIPVISTAFASPASASPDSSIPQLSMPIEHINYTITEINGTLWAKIDGEYPISLLNQPENNMLPMVYPMPPNSTNIHVILNNKEIAWINYTQGSSGALHRTAIGDWWMISCLLEDLSDSFMLKIHYEHPLETVNGSCMFLYDLNIRDYLSMERPNSTAYFTIRLETNPTGIAVYTAPPDSQPNQWQPKTYALNREEAVSIANIEMHSNYNTDLPGDLVIVLPDKHADSANKEETAPWIIPVTIDVVFVAILLYAKRKAVVSVFSSRKQLIKQYSGLMCLKYVGFILIVYCWL